MEPEKDIFTLLIEKELQSANPNPCLLKYGDLFLKNLNLIGGQLEQILLANTIVDMNSPTILVAPKAYITKAEKGISIMKLVESELNK